MFDQDNVWKNEEPGVQNIILNYYDDLFKTSNPLEFFESIDVVQLKVSSKMIAMLTADFQEFEVCRALKQMYPLKSSSPNGMPPLFFQHFWPTIGGVVRKTILDFLNLGVIPPKFNETHIVLIPKVKDPKKVTDFRPISLCNVIYKLASKVLANRLKKVLPNVISDSQSAFVHGRLITDNVLVAFETMHHINQKKNGRIGEMALKLDMSKAYDRVKWICLKKIMEKLGFNERWRRLMMQCISTVSYAVRINGVPRGHITPSHGLRQGDPLTPYLFFICAKGLSDLIKKNVQDGFMQGVAICNGAPNLSHLLFADDSLIFCKTTLAKCDSLQRVLKF